MAAKVLTLSNNEAAGGTYTRLVKIKAEDLVASAGATDTSEVVTVGVKAGAVVRGCASILKEDFVNSETAVTSVAVKVGETDDDRFLASTVIGEGTIVDYAVSPDTTDFAFTAADTIDITITCAGGSNNYISTLTAGEVWIALEVVELADIL